MIPPFFRAQEVIHSQERSITELLKAVREQSDQLNHQRVQFKTLEEKVTARDRWKCFIGEEGVKGTPFFNCYQPIKWLLSVVI